MTKITTLTGLTDDDLELFPTGGKTMALYNGSAIPFLFYQTFIKFFYKEIRFNPLTIHTFKRQALHQEVHNLKKSAGIGLKIFRQPDISSVVTKRTNNTKNC